MEETNLMNKSTYDNLNRVVDFSQVLLSYHTDDSVQHFEQVKTYTKILITYYNLSLIHI